MAQTVSVDLGDRSYDIHIGPGLLGELGSLCQGLRLGASCLVVSDAHVDAHYGPACQESLQRAGFVVARVAVPAGEQSKAQEWLFRLFDKALEQGLDRRGFMVALGGGVVGDLAGFAAATFLRGVNLVQVPTSLVAMVDSAVGGKTGINLPQGKNLVGSFCQPRAVVVDPDALRTLPRREYISGLAEVIKYGVIRDAGFFSLMEDRCVEVLEAEPGVVAALIARSCEIKAEVVRQDEREGGLRAILNFGHTVGHALEKVAGYGRYLHGEAIGVGMAYAARLSVARTGLPQGECDRVLALVRRMGLPVEAPAYAWVDLRQAISVDKKGHGRTPRFVLAERIGSVVTGCEVPEELLKEVWNVGCK